MMIRVDPAADGIVNMARDLELLLHVSQNEITGRIYSWDAPWVTLGHYQVAERALIPGCTVPSIVRPTGGKAVLHGHDLTIGLAASFSALNVGQRELKAAYRKLIIPVVSAMTECGIPAELGENTQFVRSAGKVADCFAHVSPNDVVDPLSGSKVCGCSLKLTDKAILMQASIPVSTPLVDPSLVFEEPAPQLTEKKISPQEFAERLSFYLQQLLDTD